MLPVRGTMAGSLSDRVMHMAKMESFDVVSTVDLQEVDNAVNQTAKEIAQRYDFKDSQSSITWDGKQEIRIVTDSKFRLEAIHEILKARMVRRKVPLKALQFGKVEDAAGGNVRQVVQVVQGIAPEKARAIVAFIKGLKLKVQPQIMDDRVRVFGKSRDELQAVIQALREQDFGIALQFTNYR